MAAATARQTSTSIPVQLPLSSGDEKPGKPWLTPQDSMPRSLTVLRVWALADWAAMPAARARVKTRGTRFIAKPFEKSPGTLLILVYADGPDPVIHRSKSQSGQAVEPALQTDGGSKGRGRPPQRAATE